MGKGRVQKVNWRKGREVKMEGGEESKTEGGRGGREGGSMDAVITLKR